MAFQDIDLTLEPLQLEIYLAKPNKTIIAKLSEGFAKSNKVKLSQINELVITIPYEIEIGHRLVRNPNIDLIKDRYLIKAVYGKDEDWYIIGMIEDNMEDKRDIKVVTAYLLPFELTSKTIRQFKQDGVSVTSTLMGGTAYDQNGLPYTFDGILKNTKWSIGYYDAVFQTRGRSFDISSVNTLDALFRVAESFLSIISFDTKNRKINFYDIDTYGHDQGLVFNYGHYVKSIKRQSKSDEMTTRFKAFGKDNISFQRCNLTGQNYIEDYSYFLYPFQRDSNKNVIKHSDYMSDELCNAMLDYTDFLKSKESQYASLLQTLIDAQNSFNFKTNERIALEEGLQSIKDNLDIANKKSLPTADIITQKTNQEKLITDKQAEIDAQNTIIVNTNASIKTLRDTLAKSNFFTQALLDELGDYIVEYEYSDDKIEIDTDLLAEAQRRFKWVKQPHVVFTIDMVNFKEIVEAQRDWYRLSIGDTITIRYDKMGIDVTARIIEYDIDHEGRSITVTIANTKDILSDEEKLIKLLYNSSSASTRLDLNQTKWDGIEGTKSLVESIINNSWDATKNSIKAGVNNSVEISQRGILIKDSDDPLSYLIAQNGLLAITNDGGNSWKHAITKDGILGERIYGKLLAGVNLTIDASDSTGTKLFTVDGNGVTIAGTKLTITGGLPPNQLDPAFKNSLVNLNMAYNGVVIDAANGLVITKSDQSIRTLLNATDGFRFQKSISGNWVDKFYYDSVSGNMVIEGVIVAKDFKINGTSIIAAGGTMISGQYIDSITTGQITVTSALPDSAVASAGTWNGKTTNLTPAGIYTGTLTASQINAISGISLGANATIDWNYVNADPKIATAQNSANSAQSSASSAQATADAIAKGTYSGGTFINGNTIYSPNISGANITGGQITSNTTIDVGSDLKVGNNIYLGLGTTTTKQIVFNGSAQINSMDSMNMRISANRTYIDGGSVWLGAGGSAYNIYVNGNLDLTNCSSVIWGSNAPVAKFG